MTPLDVLVTRLDERGLLVSRRGDHITARCPAHDDHNASLSIGVGDDDRALVCCHAGCDAESIVRSLELEPRDLFPAQETDPLHRHEARRQQQPRAKRFAVSDADARHFVEALAGNQGALERLRELRGWSPEAIRQLRLGLEGDRVVFAVRDAAGRLTGLMRYQPNPERRESNPKMMATPGSSRDLFPRPEDVPGDVLYVVEGEPDAVTGATLGLPTVAVPGASKWREDWAGRLGRGRSRVVVVADADRPGRESAQRTAAAVVEHCGDVRVLDIAPERNDGYDLGDFARDAMDDEDRKQAVALLVKAAEAAPHQKPARVPAEGAGTVVPLRPATSGQIGVPRSASWPAPLTDEAFVGLAGEIVRAIGPETEADPAALLALTLTAFGNACGRGPGFRVNGTFHATNLFVAVVGDTASGRKGTGWGAVRPVFDRAAPDWTAERVQSGLSSGEGLIHAVRDQTVKQVKEKKSGEYVEEIDDPGVEDKRLLAREGEFASVLRVMRREGNTLSAMIRCLWDDGHARTITKGNPERATGALVSIIGDITPAELRRELDDTSAANGFANRFLFVCARRSKELPFGGDLDADVLAELGARVRDALRAASVVQEVKFDPDAAERWKAEYGRLGRGAPGLFGAVTGRAEAQVRRLAVLYALIDGASTIRLEHLRAALELWRYCSDSARHVFGDKLGDRLADKLLGYLYEEPAGLTRGAMRDKIGGSKEAARIEEALDVLADAGLARCMVEETGGRPAHRWFANTVEEREQTEESPPADPLSYLSYLSSTPNGHAVVAGSDAA